MIYPDAKITRSSTPPEHNKEGATTMATPTKTTTEWTHFLIVDIDDDRVLAWYPKAEADAEHNARAFANEVRHQLREGRWVTPDQSGLTRGIWVHGPKVN